MIIFPKATKTEPVYIDSSDEEDIEVKFISPKVESPFTEIQDGVPRASNKENDDPQKQPVFESPVKGYTAEGLLNIIVGGQVKKDKLCKRVPRGIRQHALFIVDTERKRKVRNIKGSLQMKI